MSVLRWERVESPPEPVEPDGGWQEATCSFESHKWALEVEDGHTGVRCLDPCDPAMFRPSGPTPTCLVDWPIEDFFSGEPLPVALTYVEDSTPSTPAGPGEYGYYIEVRPAAAPSPSDGEQE